MTNPYNQNSGPVYPSGPVYQQPQKPDRTMAVLLSVIGVIVLVGLGVLGTLFFLKNDDGGSETPPPAAQQPAQQAPPAAEPAPQPQAQPQQVEPAPAPAPAAQSPQDAAAANGFVYSCGSGIYRSRTGTTCAWAEKVRSEILSRGGGFNSVGIYSSGAGTTIYTSCWDAGPYWQCTGRNSTIAVLK